MKKNSAKDTEQLHELEQKVLLDSIHDGIWVIDANGITIRINSAMEHIAGIKYDDVVGKHVMEAMHVYKFTSCVTLHALELKRTITMFDDYANGKRCLNTSTPIFDDDGNVWRVIASIRDMTELEQSQSHFIEVNTENQNAELSPETQENFGIIGTSYSIIELRKKILKASKTEATCLILGDTGTGKSLVAKRIHGMSSRKKMPFIALNCGAIPVHLIESEFFGYDKGSFTGALREGKKGVFELAKGGTLFLDEIAELPLATQAALLHVLDDGVFRRVGGANIIKSDVRIILATNKNLEEMVANGTFREDLFYRIRVLPIEISALRDRVEDIPTLAYHFLHRLEGNKRNFSSELLNILKNHDWAGNIRELAALVEYLVTMCEKNLFSIEDLPAYFLKDKGLKEVGKNPFNIDNMSLQEALEYTEKTLIKHALEECSSTYKAAKKLKVSQSTIVRKTQKYNL